MIKQTGFLYKFNPTDYITGASPLVIPDVMPSADWQGFLPNGEKQYKYATFDTMSCTSFSFLNVIETWVNWHKQQNHFTQKQIETMNSLGFFADGKFNCSDRFTAITSGTMPNGNYFQNVGDAVRNKGLLPEAVLPFGGNTQAEYLDVSLITPQMFTDAKKILDILDISYEWTPVEGISTSLKQCPIQGAIPFEATHAIEVVAPGYYFDSYEPYVKELPVVRYAMKVVVKVKPELTTYKYFSPKEVAKWKLKPELWQMLDKAREIAGIPFIINSGLRSEITNEDVGGVVDSSHLDGSGCDIRALNSQQHYFITKGLYAAGFRRISRKYPLHIHCDIDLDKPQDILF